MKLFDLNYFPNPTSHSHSELVSESKIKSHTKRFFAFAQNDRIRKKAAFTLAEVLITLGIIGIVAALTIPNLVTANKKRKIEAKLSKAVSTINQVIKQSEAENGEMETWDKSLPPVEYIDKYIRPYTKIMQICKGQGSCGFKNIHNVWLNLSRQGYNLYNNPFSYNRVPFVLMDGVMYVWGTSSSDGMADNKTIIIIDITGSEGPNIFGQDVFFLQRIEEEDAIIPYGARLPMSKISNDCKKNGFGLYCAALIRTNGWKIPHDYPIN